MANFTSFLKKTDWFYLSLLIFAVAFPLSESLISISIALVFIAALVNFKKNRFKEIQYKNNVYFLAGIYFVYLIGCLFCQDWHWGLYDLRKSLAYLIIPVAFTFGNSISAKQLKRVLILFVIAVVVSSSITLFSFLLSEGNSVLAFQKAGFIHHIRFGIQLNVALIIISILYFYEYRKLTNFEKLLYIMVFIFLILILIFRPSGMFGADEPDFILGKHKQHN